jgi:hypothetical protein
MTELGAPTSDPSADGQPEQAKQIADVGAAAGLLTFVAAKYLNV